MGLDLRVRDRQPELMDQPGLDPAKHLLALRGLRRINAWSRTVPAIWSRLLTELNAKRRDHDGQTLPLRVLDVACGGGDTVLALNQLAARSSHPIQVDGCDISSTAVQIAQRSAAGEQSSARFFVADALQNPLPDDYDVVMCSLFLHHLDEADAVSLLQRMMAARRLVLVNDLRRTRLGYVLAYLGTRILSRSPIVHVDGPLSVRAAWTEDEVRCLAKSAGMDQVSFVRFWPQRFLMSWTRGS
ncbi:MAG: methyltransferase domain-containing protein [Planctomycetales bacterium]|nr:methyltransferase domain-containing protein [Planctomycetales bacterium]